MPEDFLDNLAEVGVRVLIAAAVLVVGRILAGLGRWTVDRLTRRPKAAKNLGPTMRKFLGQALFAVIMLMALVIALAALGVPQNVLLWGVGIVLVVLAVALSRSLGNLAATVLFMGWFGPRGLASIVLGLVYLEEEARLPGEETIKLAVMVTVLLSIFAHGFSTLPGIDRYARRVAALDTAAPEHRG